MKDLEQEKAELENELRKLQESQYILDELNLSKNNESEKEKEN